MKYYYDWGGEFLPIRDVVKVYMAVRKQGFKVETIQNAWRKSGIEVTDPSGKPRTNIGIFTEADFLPSASSSTQLHLPPDYPLLPDVFANDSDDDDDDNDNDDNDESIFNVADGTQVY